MRYLWLACAAAILFAACRQTTSPSVPKPAIEKAADTKIEDAGPLDAQADK